MLRRGTIVYGESKGKKKKDGEKSKQEKHGASHSI